MHEPGLSEIPLFPLPNVVLFPEVSVPLFIFEPRYRAMVRESLAADRKIGMVAVRPEAGDEIAGNPPVFEIGCEGTLSHAEEEPDGTWKILLTATRRFRIVEETHRPEERPYRTAQIEGLPEEEPPEASDERAALRGEVLQSLRMIGSRTLAGESRKEVQRRAEALRKLEDFDDGRFMNVVAQAIEMGVLEKQQLLEAAGSVPRYRILDSLLRFRLTELDAGPVTASGILH